MNKTSSFLSIAVFLLALATHTSAANPGDLDPTFGTGGKVYNTPANLMPAEDVAVQADGKLVIVGSTLGPDNTQDFGVVRLNANGTPDTNFGTGGLVQIPFDLNFNEMATAVVIQSDGKIVVAGSVELGGSGWDFGIVRLNSNGTIDATYNGGKVKVGVTTTGGNDFAYDMAIQTDDKVVIVGTTRPTPNNDIALVRLTTGGTLDATFNGGRINISFGGGTEDEAYGVALQTDGSVIIAGTTMGDFCVLRITTGGLPDGGFGLGGFQVTPVGTQNDKAYSVAIQSDGKIVLGGTANSGLANDFAFVRYTSGGQLDTSFSGDGKATFDVVPATADELRSVLIQSDGKIIGAGGAGGSHVLVRLDTAGALDPSFGSGGKVIQNIAPLNSFGHRAILQPDGKIVSVGDGSSSGGTFGFTAARFFTVATPTQKAPFDFDNDGKTDVGIFRPSVAEWWITRSNGGAILATQFGAPTDQIVPADYTGDGKADIAVFRPSNGFWYVLRSDDFTYYAFPFGLGTDVPVPADYDSDAKADAAVFRPSTATWYIKQSSNDVTRIFEFGANGDQPAVADYDGDGKADAAIYRPSVGQWWLNRSTAGVIAMTFGNSSDKPVQGDYTGDGKADVAFFRPSTGEWFVLRSEDFSYYSFPFGAIGDTPAPGDYDGDSKFDPTVFRPSNATWYSFRATSTVIQQFGQTGDRAIPSAFLP